MYLDVLDVFHTIDVFILVPVVGGGSGKSILVARYLRTGLRSSQAVHEVAEGGIDPLQLDVPGAGQTM